jgi:hypothetical protein
VLLRFDGSEVTVERRAFWQRPLAFLPDGLVYLAAECASSAVLDYKLLLRRANGSVEELLRGRTQAGVGDAMALGELVIISRITQPEPGVRGPKAMPSPVSSGSLWAFATNDAARRELYRAPVPLTGLSSGAVNGS